MAKQDVKTLAKLSLGREETDEDAPLWYIQAVENFLKTNPMDVHFIMELGQEGKSVGGNGFGSVTCMEDYCWEDIVLDADSTMDIGQQRKMGLGSFFNYKVHCQNEKHIRGRNERCRNEGITIVDTKDPFATPAQNVPSRPVASTSNRPRADDEPRTPQEQEDLLRTLQSMDEKAKKADEAFKTRPLFSNHAGPSTVRQSSFADYSNFNTSTTGNSSPTKAPARSSTSSSSHALQPMDPNSWLSRSQSAGRDHGLKPFGSSTFGSASNRGKATIMNISDDEDDDIIELLDDRIPPGMRKSNKAPPIVVRDEDIKPNFPSSQMGSSQSSVSRHLVSQPSRSQSSASQPKAEAKAPYRATFLPKREVQKRYQQELPLLKVAHKAFSAGPTKDDYNRKMVADRYHKVELNMTLSNTSTMWFPPSEDIMTIVPSIRALVKSFDKPPTSSPPVAKAEPFYNQYTANAMAGPSSRPHVPPVPRPSVLAPHVPTHTHMISGHPHYRGMPGAFPGMMDIKPPAQPGMMDNKPHIPAFNPLSNLDAVRAYLFNPAGVAADLGSSIASALGLDGALGGMRQPPLPLVPGMDEYDQYFAEPNRPDNLQEFFTNSLNSFEEDQDVEGALKYLKLQDLQHRFKDLSVTLMPHQVLGVKFMIEQEKKPRMKGGLLADSMGLGKTLSSIAVIAGHPSEDRKVKTTLVVAPLALLEQWKAEIESKTTSGRKVLIHWGGKRTDSAIQLKQYDVVLTTYGILTAEHGKQKQKQKPKARRRNDSDDSDDGISLADPLNQGPLYKVLWYRVILDEAHMIRNKNTRACKAAWDLNSIYRWCLTGTPVMNTLGDLYPILHFLNISPQADWKEFSAHIMKPEKKRPTLAVKRMQAILKTCSIRRNKDSTLNGVRLLNLPAKTINWDELELSVDERHIYTSIEHRMQVKFNALLKRGTVLKHYSMVLVMLVRLKQATSHPFLLTRRAEDAAHPEDVVISDEELMGTRDAALLDDMKELQRALDHMGQEYVDKVAQMLEDRWKEVQKHPEGGEDSNQLGTECSICFEPYEHEHAERVTECCHSYCATCMENLWNDAPRTSNLTEEQLEQNMRQCPLCREPISREKVFRASAFFNPEEQADIKPIVDGEASTSLGKRPSEDAEEDVKPALKKLTMSKGKGKATDYKEKVKAEETQDKKPEAINFDEIDITPSTKMRHLLAVIQEKLQDPTCKVVAYSQFTSFLDLCGAYLQANGVSALQYQGSMAAQDRQKVLNSFNTPTDIEGGHNRVLLLSLKAGGVGLNLTVSNVVIALDLAWNAATEDQAVDRCHRIGQVKEVDVRRLCVKNSIDERIRDLQENKRKLADGALGEGEGGKLGRLSINDLIRLFNVDGGGHDV